MRGSWEFEPMFSLYTLQYIEALIARAKLRLECEVLRRPLAGGGRRRWDFRQAPRVRRR